MVQIDGYHLSFDDVLAVARMNEPVELAKSAVQVIDQSASWVLSIENSSKPVYGVNTGFGIFSDRIISLHDSNRLSRNLILSHAVGTGSILPTDETRAAMLVRANTLAKGFSGVRIDIIKSLLNMLNAGVTPIIPSQGSLGSSGDLAQLAHMALVFTTDQADREEESGEAFFNGQCLSGRKAMQAASLQRLILGPKEGLAIINGATFTAAIAALVVADSISFLQIADLATAMSLEALLGVVDAFHPRLQTVRGQSGQIQSAAAIRSLIQGSTLIGAAGRIQDAYSLRCAPQVHGAAYDTVQFARQIVERELNAATDNPLIFGPELAISGGNFHGEPVGMVMDYVGIAMTEIAAISERRTFRLTDPRLNAGLPPMLVDHPDDAGLNSGVMMPQYTAASLVLENRVLATPDSIQSLPTSGGQEDHNANAMTASRHARMIVDNTAQVLAIELFTAARALDLRLRDHPELKMGAGVTAAHRLIREITSYEPGDTLWGPQIDLIRKAMVGGEFINNVINKL